MRSNGFPKQKNRVRRVALLFIYLFFVNLFNVSLEDNWTLPICFCILMYCDTLFYIQVQGHINS